MPKHETLAAQAAKSLGVHRNTLIEAIRSGLCQGEEREGRWYTTDAAAAEWYKDHYRHRGALFSREAGKGWSEEANNALTFMVAKGVPRAEIAHALKRTEDAIKIQISRLRTAGEAPSAAEIKKALDHSRAIEEAQKLLAKGEPLDAYKQRRQEEREGRLRLHVHPAAKRALGDAAKRADMTLARFLSLAGLAAVVDPSILKVGSIEIDKLCGTKSPKNKD